MKYAYYFIERVMVTWELCRGFIKVSVFFFFSDCVFPLCKLIQVFCIFFSLPLNAWYNKKLRIMANSTKKSHVKNIDLHQKMGTYPLPYILQKRRLKYIGHVVRYPDDRQVKIALFSQCDHYPAKNKRSNLKRDIEKDLTLIDAELELMGCKEYFDHIIDNLPFQRPGIKQFKQISAPIRELASNRQRKSNLRQIQSSGRRFKHHHHASHLQIHVFCIFKLVCKSQKFY